LSHVVHKDVIRGLVWMAIVAPAATLLVKELAERMNGGRPLGAPASLPALALAGGMASFSMNVASNVMSRRVEARADTYALNLTRDPNAFIGLERRLAVTNLADPKTPRLLQPL